MRVITILAAVILIAGCSQEPKVVKKTEAAPKAPSTAQQAIDGFTGRTAVKQGKRAQQQIKDISAQQNKELDEVLQ